MSRNLCDDCKECEDKDKTISYCCNVCGIPFDILKNIENERNGKALEYGGRKER